jgi:hypothetical protein
VTKKVVGVFIAFFRARPLQWKFCAEWNEDEEDGDDD